MKKKPYVKSFTAGPFTDAFLARFWSKVHKTGGCWPWTASADGCGYGYIGVGNSKLARAHRVSWEIHNGPIPVGLCVLHRCDNPPCVNPAHLWLGTHQDNSDDKVAKGRHWESKKTHCTHGHPFDGENTGLRIGGGRYCRACLRIRQGEYRGRLKQVKVAA